MSKNAEKQNAEQNNGKSVRKSIHTTISNESYELLEKYAALEDKNNQKIFGNKSKVIEQALELLDKHYNPEKNESQETWNRLKEELNMVLVGKTTFLSYISGDYEKAFKKNIAIELIEWYKGKNIDDLTLNELLLSIKNIWLVANYFYKIDIEIGSKGTYQMSFYHDFHKKRFSDFWGNYFSELLRTQKECEVEIFSRNESLVLRITPT